MELHIVAVKQSETHWKVLIVWSNITFGLGEHSGLEEKSQSPEASLYSNPAKIQANRENFDSEHFWQCKKYT